jgi:hypothetical protein
MPNLRETRAQLSFDRSANHVKSNGRPPVAATDTERCDCELPGYFCCGVPGVLAHLEDGKVSLDCFRVERCDACERFESDAAAEAGLRELGLFSADDPRSLAPDQRLPTYTVHCYATVRVKLPGIPATDPRDAACRASDLFDWDRHQAGGEFADEISEYLVDIDGDEDFSRSQRFDGDLNPFGMPASRETAWLLVIDNETHGRIHVCSSQQSAFLQLYEFVQEQWDGTFGDEPIDPDPTLAVRRFFDAGSVSYTLEERALQ